MMEGYMMEGYMKEGYMKEGYISPYNAFRISLEQYNKFVI